MGDLKAATSLTISSMFQPALGFINIVTTIPNNNIIGIEMLEPRVKDSLVANPVLTVHDEHRVGRKAAQHLTTSTHYFGQTQVAFPPFFVSNQFTWPAV